MSIRTFRRLGDATSNIAATVGPAEATSPAVMNWIQASLSAQGIDPATASPAQIMTAYRGFAAAQTFQNVNPVFGQPAAVSAPAPIAPTLPLPAPVPVSLPAPAPVSLPVFKISPAPATAPGFPAWGWAAAAGAAALLLFSR